MRLRFPLQSLVLIALLTASALAQSPDGTINGLVLDPSGKAIVGADITAVNDLTGVQYFAKTNNEGIYVVSSLPPGPYRLQVSRIGFKTLIKPDIILNVQDALAINFTLPVGAASETVTVEAGAPLVNTESAAVSTVVDRQFAENLPMNGRSFQTLIELTPGVVLTSTSNGLDSGQFSVNGQRASANYWMVDGVSANVGGSAFFGGNGTAGAVGTSSVFGGTNSLVSVDAMQEFRIQTSTYAPEFGRTPGGQISIVTRSGTNQFHGTAFNYLRNNVLDANNWFDGYTNSPPLPKPEERQNDFGGTFAGPLVKDRTFFFFSYEGLRLRLPQTTLTTVPDVSARQSAISAMQPFLNAFPLPNGPDDTATGIAQFNASYSNPASLDAYSLRVDHRLNNKLTLFGRYNYSPSEIAQRGLFGNALSTDALSRITVHTATAGLTWDISPQISNDLRFNYSRTNPSTRFGIDNFGGALPLTALPFPSPYTEANGNLFFSILSLTNGLEAGAEIGNLQRQQNWVDSISVQKGSHTLKFGADYRRLSPSYAPFLYSQNAFMLDVPSAESGTVLASYIQANAGATLLLRNLGMFAQDTWRATPRLTLTYGLRWEIDFSPSSAAGPSIPAVVGFNLNDLSGLGLAQSKTSPFKTHYGNVAPRIGGAYRLSDRQNWGSVLRGGFGDFYDLATSEVGNLILQSGYPFAASSAFLFGGTFPLNSAAAAPVPIVPPTAANQGTLTAFNPDLSLPYTLEWNFALQQELGGQQTFAASYIGAIGRRLIQFADISAPNPNLGRAVLVTNAGSSDYNALQLQFQRRLSRGLQVLASYTWAHSIDDASAGSFGNGANALVPTLNGDANRGPSDFDVRNAFSLGLTYEIQFRSGRGIADAVLRGWSFENIFQARTTQPVNVYDGLWGQQLVNAKTVIRPDLVPGISPYLYGVQYPGGKAFNAAAFVEPPTDPSTGAVLRQGDLGRNALRGFGAAQWDFAVHREFPIHDAVKLQFRAEMFNVLNHPNFGQPDSNLSDTTFGRSTEMLAQYLSGGQLGTGGFSALYQVGGPRSIQLALKTLF